MATDEEKSRIAKLLHDLDVPEVKLTERCSDIVKEFHKKFGQEVDEEEGQHNIMEEVCDNPYQVDKVLMAENERKLHILLSECKRAKFESREMHLTMADPKRPWRTNSNKEKLLRIDNEIKQHLDKASQLMTPMADEVMQKLVSVCREENSTAPPVTGARLRDTVDAAKKSLTNFQYRRIENSTATSIMPEAHLIEPTSTNPQ